MTNEQIESELKTATERERLVCKRVVELIRLALDRQIWLLRKHPTVRIWLIKEYKYSGRAATRRINAARLLKIAPDLGSKIASGETNISKLSDLQSTLRQEESRTGKPIATEQKQALVAAIENKSCEQTARLLAQAFPEAQKPVAQPKPIGEENWRLDLNLNPEQMKLAKRARELLSHSLPNASWEQIFQRVTELFVEENDPILRHERRAAKQTKPSPQPLYGPLTKAQSDAAIARSGGACESTHQGKRCGGRMRIQVDHIIPRAQGGTNELSNLQALCAAHNRLKAEQDLGPKHANAWRNDRKGAVHLDKQNVYVNASGRPRRPEEQSEFQL